VTYTPIARGTQDWDTPVNAAFTDQDTRITSNTSAIQTINNYRADTAADRGAVGWSGNPAMFANAAALPLGVLAMTRISVPVASTINSVSLSMVTAGATLTAGQNLVGIYDATGSLLGQTADQASNWVGTTGLKTMALTSPISVSPGNYFIGALANGTTGPSMLRSLSSANMGSTVNFGLTTTNAYWANSGSSLTALPASVSMSARTLSTVAWWAALS